MNSITRRIASLNFQKQIKTLATGNKLADDIAAILRKAFRAIEMRVKSAEPHEVVAAQEIIETVAAHMTNAVIATVADRITNLVRVNYKAASVALSETMPMDVLLKQAAKNFAAGSGLGLPSDLGKPGLSVAEKRDLVRELVFPPPTKAQVDEIVYRGNWAERLANQTSAGAPRDLAQVIQQGTVAGKSETAIARELQDKMQGVASSARRVARQECTRVAHETNFRAWSNVDDLIVGYTVHAVLDDATRPQHRARNGDEYFKQPAGHQSGIERMPNPPYEADGTLAHNCRCWLSPITVIPSQAAEQSKQQAGEIDRELTSEWFGKATERERSTALGAERYDYLRRTLNRRPTWEDATDTDGRILGLATLKAKYAPPS